MNRPRVIIRPKPYGASRRIPRSRPEAAAELVRVEYERDRLLREMEQIARKRTASLTALKRLESRAALLHARLDSAQAVRLRPSSAPQAAPGPRKPSR